MLIQLSIWIDGCPQLIAQMIKYHFQQIVIIVYGWSAHSFTDIALFRVLLIHVMLFIAFRLW